MPAEVEFFGIRHHGPGSARRLIEALDALQPAEVLIEGPSDLSELLPMLASPAMTPPIAMLAYPKDMPGEAIFWPFAVFSPEYQAVLWAVKNAVPVRFIDLPVAWRIPPVEDKVVDSEPLVEEAPEDEPIEEDNQPDPEAPEQGIHFQIERDPIGTLARVAGYEDGESWWQHVIEENPDPNPVFDAVADAMGALREGSPPLAPFEAAREAHMRLEIAKSRKESEGAIAVVCGAWHVPALMAKHIAKDDRALIKGGPKRKVVATYTPWTSPRLTFAQGYGAGVPAPGWNQHLWNIPREAQTTHWVAQMARALRESGQIVSTASLIETERLSISLAALRGRPQPGFEELREAAIATMCFGNPIQWQTIANELLIGSEVGTIPDDVPLAPLLEDLQLQQKKTRLKPEALDRELALDLRSESGLNRSTLLHRLNVLVVPWGRLQSAGGSRGTFRERWILRWEPEHSVQLIENLVYGTTIAQAAAGLISARMNEASTLSELSELVFGAFTAQLPEAADTGTCLLEGRAAQTSDCLEMLRALPAIADVLRYGKARATNMEQMEILFQKIAVQGALALSYAARNLDDSVAKDMREAVRFADQAIRLLDMQSACENWSEALLNVAHDVQATALVSGQAARSLYDADEISSDAAVLLLERVLSPGIQTRDAAGFFEGFLDGIGTRLIHDVGLRDCVGAWLQSLDPDIFIESLPLFRRVFSNMDKMERKRLLDTALGKDSAETGMVQSTDASGTWDAQFERVVRILKGSVDG